MTEDLIKGVADELVSGGYRDAGYVYVAVDDGWSTSRDPATNALRPDPAKFPSGIAALAQYVHDRGLLLGMYADVGTLTCGGYSGLGMDAALKSKQYVADVATFAEWGVDALKGVCGGGSTTRGVLRVLDTAPTPPLPTLLQWTAATRTPLS